MPARTLAGDGALRNERQHFAGIVDRGLRRSPNVKKRFPWSRGARRAPMRPQAAVRPKAALEFLHLQSRLRAELVNEDMPQSSRPSPYREFVSITQVVHHAQKGEGMGEGYRSDCFNLFNDINCADFFKDF